MDKRIGFAALFARLCACRRAGSERVSPFAFRGCDLRGYPILLDAWPFHAEHELSRQLADLSTEPRWYRVHETFTEDSQLASEIITTLIKNLQGERLNSKSIALTIKHFPGGGPQEGGGDPLGIGCY